MEFKKGLQGIQDELTVRHQFGRRNLGDNAAPGLTHSETAFEDYEEATAPKFEPPPSPPSPLSAQSAQSEPSPESISS